MDWRWELLPALLLALLWLFVIRAYPDLPAQVVTHIDGAGNGDKLGIKNIWNVAGVTMIGTGMWLSFLLLNRLLIGKAKDFRRYINLPNKDKIPDDRLEEVRYLSMSYLFLINLFIIFLLGYIQIETVRLSHGLEMLYPMLIWFMVIVPTFGTVWFLIKISAITGKKR